MKKASLLLLCGSLVNVAIKVQAADPADSAVGNSRQEAQQVATQIASQALVAEANGDFLGRQRLLSEAELLDSDCVLAKSQKSEVKIDDTWLTVDQCVARLDNNRLIAEYEQLRGTTELNLDQHLRLAQWCLQKQLMLQAYGHLNRVIQLDPDNEPALRALGYQQVGNEWISPAQLQEARAMAENTQASLAKFGKQLQEVKRGLASPRPAVRDGAIATFKAINDPSAVPAVESILSSPNANIASLVIDWLAAVDSLESSQALTRYALFHPENNAQQQAREKLKTRPLHDFVPELIELTVSPVAAMLVPVFAADGTLSGYRQAFAKEGAERNNLLVVDTTIRRFSIGTIVNEARDNDNAIVRTVDMDVNAANRRIERTVNELAAQDAMQRQAAVQQANAAIQARNVRIAELLSFVSGEEISSTPQAIWQWWDKYNESDTQLAKGTNLRRSALTHIAPRYEAYGYARRPEFPNRGRLPIGNMSSSGALFGDRAGSGSRMGGFSGPIQPECFVAGTPVLTHKGLTPVDRVRTGDLVLSRDLSSGSLAWKPVIVATQRPPEATKEIQTSSQSLRCTGGHLFWVSGKGWVKASELKPADVLHCAGEPTVVMDVKEMPAAPTFNLSVADNANYFVGSELVLTHDVTKREPTRLRVPGLHEIAIQTP
ncbi:MAG: polymorphic toxin-type HINT domain-containing protein [Pirellulaceae bacterium]|nr:polymorphic toxin-type HINT domain-containing protein [Pirellulaceae bacterium]